MRMSDRIEIWRVDDLNPYERNARTHSAAQIKKIVKSITEFGFTNPILVDEGSTIIAGHGRLAAALELGMDKVPVIQLTHLTPEKKRAYIIADNKLAELAGWDEDILKYELGELAELEYDLGAVGFSDAELSSLLPGGDSDDEDDDKDEDFEFSPPKKSSDKTTFILKVEFSNIEDLEDAFRDFNEQGLKVTRA